MDVCFPWLAVFDDDDLRGERHFALGKSIKRVEDLFRILAAGQPDFNFHFSSGIIIDRFNFYFTFFGRLVDRADQALGGCAVADVADDECFGIFDLDLRAELDFPRPLSYSLLSMIPPVGKSGKILYSLPSR